MVKVLIERYNDQLEGLGYIDGKIIFVPNTIIGEEVDVKVIQDNKTYLRGKVVNNASEVDCPYFYKCGGCNLRKLSYSDTLKLKKGHLAHLLEKGKLDYEVINVFENKYPYNYRNKISLKISNKKIGYYQDYTNDLVEINTCLIASIEINKFIKEIPSFNIKNGFITIRSNYNDELLITIDTKDNIQYDFNKLKEDYKIAGIVVNGKSIINEDFFIDRINNYLFKVSHDAFFQVNNFIAGVIFDLVYDFLDEEDKVLDLYSGVGTLSICAAGKARNVLGIEIVENAIKNALVNKKMNKVDNVEFILSDVPKALNKLEFSYDAIIVDPPRKGLDKFTRDYLFNSDAEKIIYVSCNPITLVRDLDYLKERYSIKSINLLDMFSFTYHYETLVLLENNKK